MNDKRKAYIAERLGIAEKAVSEVTFSEAADFCTTAAAREVLEFSHSGPVERGDLVARYWQVGSDLVVDDPAAAVPLAKLSELRYSRKLLVVYREGVE